MLLVSFLISNYKRKYEKYLFELNKKFDDFYDIKKSAYIIADEIKKLLAAEVVIVAEYTYFNVELLTSIPDKYLDNNSISPHELYVIMQTLEQENQNVIEAKDVQSEHFKKYFPLFPFDVYKIIPIYTDENRLITLEIYGDISHMWGFKKNILFDITSIFRKFVIQAKNFNENLVRSRKNELIINFLDRLRYTIKIEEFERIVLEEISRLFLADRTCLIITKKQIPYNPILKREYLGSPYVQSLRGNNLDFESVWEQLKNNKITPPVFVIENSEKFIKYNKLENTPIDIFIKKSQIKSSYPFLVQETDDEVTYLLIQFTRQFVTFKQDDFEMMELFVKQIKIAFSQIVLYSELQKNSQTERLLIDIISILRSSVELKKVANDFTAKVGTFFDAQRCVIRFFDAKSKQFMGYNEAFEYKRNYYIPSTKDYSLQNELDSFLLESEKFHDVLAINYSTDLINKNFKYKDNLIQYADRHAIRSYMAAFVRYNGKLLGVLALHFEKERSFSKEDENLLKILANQLGIAIYQSEMYFDIQNVAKKEKLLKEIYIESVSLQTKKQVYEYFAGKIMQLLSATGVVFIEFPDNDGEEKEYFENYKNAFLNLAKFKNIAAINNMIRHRILSSNCNLQNNSEDKEFLAFLKDTSTVCIITIPFGENSLILIFLDTKKEFSNYDKNILFSLINVISMVINESIQRMEINNLREGFLSTLAHDLQIPLIAERNAINYLTSKKEISNNETIREILNNLQESNLQADNMVKALTSIYSYESGKKELHKTNCNIVEIAEDCISKFSSNIDNKKINILKVFNAENKNFYGDKIEIGKTIMIFLLAAIDNTKENGNITVEITENLKYLKLCVHCDGKIISDNIKPIILDRNILTNTLNHRIGEGIYFYLAKLIINKHHGKIYINNKVINGNVFCIELEKLPD